MIKRLFVFMAIIASLFCISFYLNSYWVSENNVTLLFPLFQVYIFQAIAALIVYVLIELIFSHLPNETGYLYLALTMMKLGVFILLFQKHIFSEQPLTKADKVSLIVPLFIFLIAEVVAVSKLLNKNIDTTGSLMGTHEKN